MTVQPSGTALSTTTATPIKATAGLSFDVKVQNQGGSVEKAVAVKLAITGGAKPITVEQRIDTINPGETQTVSIPLPTLPPTGRPVTITITVAAVPGEKNLTNNKATYQAIFTAG
jgi:hypothetical protein